MQQLPADPRRSVGSQIWFCLVLMVAACWLSGCATKDPDDIEARPWNSPRGWESGLPPGMFERR